MKCFHCGEDHTASKCSVLYEPLKDGFYSGGGGGGGHSYNEEDKIHKNGFKKFKVRFQYSNKHTTSQNVLLRV